MKGDFSKLRFDAKKHYHDVLMQQGRVMLDSDWNEQGAITAYRTETGTKDIIGDCGVPMHNAGFLVSPFDNAGKPVTYGKDLKIFKGRMYVDGILCENDADVLFGTQPNNPETFLPAPSSPPFSPPFSPPSSPPGAGATYLFYLDVWQRHITVLEDPSIREVALGGPDTTSRSKTIWQVKFADTSSITGGVNCLTNLPADIIHLSTGLLSARSEQSTGTDDPCGLAASGGYRRLENQLYRVEVHTGGLTRAATKFKWSRDNGSIAVKWESVDSADPNKLIAGSTGRDELLGFKSGNWVELIDDTTDLLGKPGIMVQLSQVNGNVLMINPATIKDPNNASATTVTRSTKNPRIRRWDSDGILPMNISNTAWVKLEDGVEVKFTEGIYKTGDYWLIPARTSIADVEWPKDNANPPLPLPLPAEGIQHHFCKLAILEVDSFGQWTLKSDCRPNFPPLTELTNLYYAGGDGQEAMSGNKLPATLKVGVANGKWAVQGAKIKFEIVSGGGTLNPLNVSNGFPQTDSRGIAECEWTLGTDTTNLLLQVRASLVDAANNVMSQQLPVTFNASFSIADNVFYDGGDCDNWEGGKPDTVAAALTALCKRSNTVTKRSCSITVGEGGDFGSLKEAWGKLKDETNICICLLPGEHKTDDINFDNEKLETLKITGCGAIVKMFGKQFNIRAYNVILNGFKFEKVIETASDNFCRIVIEASDTDVMGCSFSGADHERYFKMPFILIRTLKGQAQGDDETQRRNNNIIHWNKNTISVGKKSAGIGLALEPGIEGWIETNRIMGGLVLLYIEAAASEWTEDLRKKIEDKIENDQIIFKGQLTIRGNIMGNIMTNISGFFQNEEPLSYSYLTLIVSENVLHSVRWDSPARINSLLSAYINLVNNQFTEPDIPNPVSVVGKKNVVIGNIAANDNTIIQIFRGNKIGIPPPDLNLVQVIL